MAGNVVNLDAMIPREDMAEVFDTRVGNQERIDIHHLDDNFFGEALRKPDFQRETAHWSPDKVVDLIRSFVDGDLIPAVILWKRAGNVFVIDGAHRLGALIAWVRDDYGDQRKSSEYFGGRIPEEQRRIAEQVRKTVNTLIGPYGEFASARKNPQNARPEIQARLANLAVNTIVAQWVPAVDAKAAEGSFFKINQAATPIDPTERRILKSRASPNAVAARAIVRGGTGHKYWTKYAIEAQAEIEQIAKHVHSALYEPPIGDGPVKTLDLPLAGRGYNALPFVFDLVNWANAVPEPKGQKETDGIEPDVDGSQTIKFLKAVKRSIDLLTGNAPMSLGLHPAVYCYTRGGEFQPAALLAVAEFISALEKKGQLKKFAAVRHTLEDFLIAHKDFITLTIKKTGAGKRSQPRIVRYLQFVTERLAEGLNDGQIVSALEGDEEFSYLQGASASSIRLGEAPTAAQGKAMPKSTKSASFLNAALQSPVRCALCGGLIHKNSISIDHVKRKGDGGGAAMQNAQVVHPYCNSIKG